MAGGNSPYGMYRTPVLCSLKHQDAWSLREVRILLDDFRGSHTIDKFPCKQSIGREFVVSVL